MVKVTVSKDDKDVELEVTEDTQAKVLAIRELSKEIFRLRIKNG